MSVFSGKCVDILLIEDSPGDQRLTQEALKEGKIKNKLSVVEDGEDAIRFLQKEGHYADAPTPDLILLDLNLPKMDGRELLVWLKSNDRFRMIPVIILTTSKADEDILQTYNLNANCFISKPVDFDQFVTVVQKIEDFWFTVVKLPHS